MRSETLRSSLPVQAVFVVLLTTCLGMVVWWVLDHIRHSEEMTADLLGSYEAEAEVGRTLVERYGLTSEEVALLLPAVHIDRDGSSTVSAARRRALEEQLASRQRRDIWEGSFLVLVLLATLGLIGVTLRQRTELLRRQQNFLAAVSHELKSPLASLKLSAETLLMRDPDFEGRKRLGDRMVLSIERLNTMVSNLLSAAQLDKGGVQLEPEELALDDVTARAAQPFIELASTANIDLRLEVPSGLHVRADPTAASLVIANLIDNAGKSVKAKGAGVVQVTARREGGEVRLDVLDDGLGFDPALADRLFEEFFRAGDELRRRTKGVGLGLHIARNFVELDGGRIRAESDGPGRGARFTVWWPSAPSEPKVRA